MKIVGKFVKIEFNGESVQAILAPQHFIAWTVGVYGTDELNLIKQKHIFVKKPKNIFKSKHKKSKPGLVTLYETDHAHYYNPWSHTWPVLSWGNSVVSILVVM